MKLPLLLFSLLSAFYLENCPQEPDTHAAFSSFVETFTEGYKKQDIPELQLSYIANFEAIGSVEELNRQQAFFEFAQKKYSTFKEPDIPLSQYVDYLLIGHEIDLNLERIALECAFNAHYPEKNFPHNGLFHLVDSEAWYNYYLKKWLGADVDPEALFEFGLYEVHVVADAMANIRQQTGLAENNFAVFLDKPEFFEEDSARIQETFEEKRIIVRDRLDLLFHDPERVPEVHIAEGDNAGLSDVPGYYSPASATFYYNLFGKPYNTRMCDLLFIHEGNPGHHLQSSIEATLNLPEYRSFFSCYGYLEGWAAYVEELGQLVGLYKTPWDYLGKWEWDQIRSIRLALDVGINKKGWTDETALTFWQAYLPGKDDIAIREIKRMRKWPAQVHTYKYGAVRIMKIKEHYKERMGNNFDIRDFHETILEKGPLPLDVLEKVILRELDRL